MLKPLSMLPHHNFYDKIIVADPDLAWPVPILDIKSDPTLDENWIRIQGL